MKTSKTERKFLTTRSLAEAVDIYGNMKSECPGYPRKIRLVACAILRSILPFISNPNSRHAVIVGERMADNLASNIETTLTQDAMDKINYTPGNKRSYYETHARICLMGTKETERQLQRFNKIPGAAEIARDILGNPFAEENPRWNYVDCRTCRADEKVASQNALRYSNGREGNLCRQCGSLGKIRVSPHWLTRKIFDLEEFIYTDRRFEMMPMLADALEEECCDYQQLIDHCRSEPTWPSTWHEFTQPAHARGCWALDWIRGMV